MAGSLAVGRCPGTRRRHVPEAPGVVRKVAPAFVVARTGHLRECAGQRLDVAHEVVSGLTVPFVHVLGEVTYVDDGVHAFLRDDAL